MTYQLRGLEAVRAEVLEDVPFGGVGGARRFGGAGVHHAPQHPKACMRAGDGDEKQEGGGEERAGAGEDGKDGVYRGSMSAPKHLAPKCASATSIEAVPTNGSNTMCPLVRLGGNRGGRDGGDGG